MSLIKELKSKPDNSVNVIDFIDLILSETKTKYTELFLKIFKGTIDKKYSDNILEAKNMLLTLFPEKEEDIKKMSTYNVIMFSYLFDVLHETKIDIETFNRFIEYNERNLIDKKDLTTYSTYDEIHNQVLGSEFKLKEKELEKQVVKIFENDEWLMLKPLVFEASLKYGYGTKWCTAMENDKTYYTRYSKEGILIYFINKISGVKVAVYKKIYDGSNELKTPEISFWNEIDKQIDSFGSGLPGYLLDELRGHFDKHPITNKEVLDLMNGKKLTKKPMIESDLNEDKVGYEEPVNLDGLFEEDVEESDDIMVTENEIPENGVMTQIEESSNIMGGVSIGTTVRRIN